MNKTMENFFLLQVEEYLVPQLAKHGWAYNKERKMFLCYFNEIVFRLRIDFGNFFEITFGMYAPLLQENYQTINLINSIPNSKRCAFLDLDKYVSCNKSLLSQIMQEDILLMYTHIDNYIHNIMSALIYDYSLESFIKMDYMFVYDDLIEQDEALYGDDELFLMEKSSKGWIELFNNWGRKEDEEFYKYKLIKMEQKLPFEEFQNHKEDIIKINEKQYYDEIQNMLDNNQINIFQTNVNVQSVSIEKLYKNYIFLESLEALINKYNFIAYEDDYYQSINIKLFVHKLNPNIELEVKIENNVFLSFVLQERNKSVHYIYKYDDYFSYGWLIGNKNLFEENTKNALETLFKTLETMEI